MEETKTEIPAIAEPTTQNLVEEAKQAAKEIKEEREKIEVIRNEMRELEARRILGGKSYAGQTAPVQETADEKWAREAKIRYAGTGMDPTPKKVMT